MVRYQVRLVFPGAPVGILPASVVSDLLDLLQEGNLRALRLRIEGRSRTRGGPPKWLREAASFNLVGFSYGSVIISCEAAPLRQVLPAGLLGLLGSSFEEKPCAALFAQSLAAVLSKEDDALRYDEGLLETFCSFARIFAQGCESIGLHFEYEEPWAQQVLHREDVEKIQRVRRQLASQPEVLVELTGDLVRVDLDRRRYTLMPDTGSAVEGFADDLLIEGLAHLLGTRVSISGSMISGRGGGSPILLTNTIQPAGQEPISPSAESAPRARLTRLELHGFRSIHDISDLHLGQMNVLIGANGAGKSNLVSLFKLLEALASTADALPTYVARAGGANALLHDGAATTQEIRASLSFETEARRIDYAFRLVYAAPDTLLFAEEKYRVSSGAAGVDAPWVALGAGHRESSLHRVSDPTAKAILGMLRQTVAYQLHNTSETARIRQRWSVSDGRALKTDAANLAPFLLRLRESRPDAYTRIVETIRQIAPFFADFSLEPLQGSVMLQWHERNADVVFQPHQSSDGTLRAMALVALLLQPQEDLPARIIVDEPELGLHPYAINVIAGLFRSASHHAQVILATQSTTFLDLFEPAEIVVVDRPSRASHFRRLDPEELKEWLEEYSLGELWEKNVLGGRPAR